MRIRRYMAETIVPLDYIIAETMPKVEMLVSPEMRPEKPWSMGALVFLARKTASTVARQVLFPELSERAEAVAGEIAARVSGYLKGVKRSEGIPPRSTEIFAIEQISPERYRLWEGKSRCPLYAAAVSHVALKSVGLPFTEKDLWSALSAVLYESGMPQTTFTVTGRSLVERMPSTYDEAWKLHHKESYGFEYLRTVQPVPPGSRIVISIPESKKLHAVTRWIHSTFSIPFSTLSIEAFVERASRYFSSVGIPITREEISRWIEEAEKVTTNPQNVVAIASILAADEKRLRIRYVDVANATGTDWENVKVMWQRYLTEWRKERAYVWKRLDLILRNLSAMGVRVTAEDLKRLYSEIRRLHRPVQEALVLAVAAAARSAGLRLTPEEVARATGLEVEFCREVMEGLP